MCIRDRFHTVCIGKTCIEGPPRGEGEEAGYGCQWRGGETLARSRVNEGLPREGCGRSSLQEGKAGYMLVQSDARGTTTDKRSSRMYCCRYNKENWQFSFLFCFPPFWMCFFRECIVLTHAIKRCIQQLILSFYFRKKKNQNITTAEFELTFSRNDTTNSSIRGLPLQRP